MDSELVTPSLSHTLGPGLGKVLNSYSPWSYDAGRGDAVPINHIVRLETFGQRCLLGAKLQQEYRLRLVTTRDQSGKLQRRHLVINCDLFDQVNSSQLLVGQSEFWMALTRPFAPPGERNPVEVPAALTFLNEHQPGENDLVNRPIESYRYQPGKEGRFFHHTVPQVFHINQSDLYRHINTVRYMERAQDLLALLYQKVGGNAGRMRFHQISIYYRKPFVPGQRAEVDLDLVEQEDQFKGAIRFYHCDGEGVRSQRISVAMKTQGPLTGN